jgi:hypothetical protein
MVSAKPPDISASIRQDRMGKAERNRQQNARQRVAMQQAAARRAEAQRRTLIAGGSVLLVIVIVVALVLAKTLNHSTAAKITNANTTAVTNQAVADEIASVPASAFDKVGAGPTGTAAVAPLKSITDTALTLHGKPEVLYMGAEYCPYCGAERWAIAVALSRFGTFSNLHFIHSTPDDVFSNTSTLTFYKSDYTSKYLSFVPVEMETITKQPLQNPTSAQATLMDKYTGGTFPFIDVAGKYIAEGPQYLPSVLGTTENEDSTHFGLTWAQIGADLQNPNNLVAQSVIGSANHLVAAICKVTNGQPGNVCKSKSVTSVSGSI